MNMCDHVVEDQVICLSGIIDLLNGITANDNASGEVNHGTKVLEPKQMTSKVGLKINKGYCLTSINGIVPLG